MVTCEVCVDSVSGAAAAALGGAHRIELCAGLVEGGVTPSAGTVALVSERVPIDTVVLIRPRKGDFLYTEEEFATMQYDIERIREAGSFGVALGLLTEDARVDADRTGRLIEIARPLSVTFHRAFDMTRDPAEALETLIDLGVDRVLTSGQKRSVPEALDQIGDLVKRAAERIAIMPGGGVRETNIREVVERTGAREVHFTAFARLESRMSWRNPEPVMGAAEVPGEYELQATDPGRVRSFVRAVSEVA